MERAYRLSSQILSAVLCLLGAAILITTLSRGGGVLAFGVLLGCALLALGAGRLWLARDRSSP